MVQRKKTTKKTARPQLNECRVRVAIGLTLNIGNYESVRVDVEQAATVEDSSMTATGHAACTDDCVSALSQMLGESEAWVREKASLA